MGILYVVESLIRYSRVGNVIVDPFVHCVTVSRETDLPNDCASTPTEKRAHTRRMSSSQRFCTDNLCARHADADGNCTTLITVRSQSRPLLVLSVSCFLILPTSMAVVVVAQSFSSFPQRHCRHWFPWVLNAAERATACCLDICRLQNKCRKLDWAKSELSLRCRGIFSLLRCLGLRLLAVMGFRLRRCALASGVIMCCFSFDFVVASTASRRYGGGCLLSVLVNVSLLVPTGSICGGLASDGRKLKC